MAEKYVHAKIDAKVEGSTPKSFLVVLDGVKKWLAYSKILSIDVAEEGTISVDSFKEVHAKRKVHVESVEMDEWLATEIHGLEIIED